MIHDAKVSLSAIAVFALLAAACPGSPPEDGEEPTPAPESGAAAAPTAEGVPAPPGGEPAPAAQGAVDPSAAEGSAQGEACVGVAPQAVADGPYGGTPAECPTCVGAATPDWKLLDVQPSSCGTGRYYGLQEFVGAPTLVVLLSAGCGYCLSQAAQLEKLWWELDAAGHRFHFVIVNMWAAGGALPQLLERVSFPVFQDTQDLDVWTAMGGAKDDFYFYDSEGALAAWFKSGGVMQTALTSESGYANVRDAMLHLLGEDVAMPEGSGVDEPRALEPGMMVPPPLDLSPPPGQ